MTWLWVILGALVLSYLYAEILKLKQEIKLLNGANDSVIKQLSESLTQTLLLELEDWLVADAHFNEKGHVTATVIAVENPWCELEIVLDKKKTAQLLVRIEEIKSIIEKVA